MPKKFTSKTQQIGELGENIATRFLVKHGYSIIERNYTKKWGEIDIIAEKHNKLYFIEVKSVSRVTLNSPNKGVTSLGDTRSSQNERKDEYRPEDNMHPWKLKRISRTIQTYLVSNRISDEKEWQVDLIVVYLDMSNKKAKVKSMSDIVL